MEIPHGAGVFSGGRCCPKVFPAVHPARDEADATGRRIGGAGRPGRGRRKTGWHEASQSGRAEGDRMGVNSPQAGRAGAGRAGLRSRRIMAERDHLRFRTVRESESIRTLGFRPSGRAPGAMPGNAGVVVGVVAGVLIELSEVVGAVPGGAAESRTGLLHGECVAGTGRTLAENLGHGPANELEDVVRPADRPLPRSGVMSGLAGIPASMNAVLAAARRGFACDAGRRLRFDAAGLAAVSDRSRSGLPAERRHAGGRGRIGQTAGTAQGLPVLDGMTTAGRGMGSDAGRISVRPDDTARLGAARHGAATFPGGKGEAICYADV